VPEEDAMDGGGSAAVGGGCEEKSMDKTAVFVLNAKFMQKTMWVREGGR